MEYRNLHDVAQLALDQETFWRFDVLEVYTAECWLQRCNDLNQLVDVCLIDLDIKNIEISKFFEQYRLAFHDWLGCQRPDVTQSQHGGTI